MSTVQQTEFVYYWFDSEQGPGNWLQYRILKRTKQFVFVQYHDRTLKLSRSELEEKGEAKWPPQRWTAWAKYFYNEEGKRQEDQRRESLYFPECFRALGLPKDPTAEDVKRAYREMALRHHPDTGGSHEAFLQLEKDFTAALKLTHQ